MKSFLEYVAEDLIRKFGSNLADVAVVFPNKRAALFLNEHIARLSQRPVWSPHYVTISDLFRQQSQRLVADPIKLVCELHKSFVSQTGFDETLDHFYGWGQLLLSDFDDIDKNMADADKVFAQLRDIHELDDVSYLTEDQKLILQKFFSNFSLDHESELKQRFLRLWSRMGDIYHDFNQRLAQQGLAYEGALYREVAEQKDIDFPYHTYAFVGFNMLQRVEQRLFTMLKQQQRASFYWDFDDYYMPGPGKDNEAGHYIAQYLADFPNELDTHDPDIYQSFARKRNVNFIAAPTENAQARYISQWLRQRPSTKNKGMFERIEDGRKTAIVLCNENLLQTVIHCLPDEVGKLNITTGYPLIQSPVASLVTLLLNLQTQGYAIQRQAFRLKQVNAVLNHPYMEYLSADIPVLYQKLNAEKTYYPTAEMLAIDESTSLLFTHHDTHAELLQWMCDLMQRIAANAEQQSGHNTDPLFQETVFRMYTLLNRLNGLVASGDLQVDVNTLQRFITQLVVSTSVPFHGEPIEGLQVMGVLETRNLDFDHLLILSCNEGNMPKGVNDTSFIPYSIRRAYGLTTIDHKVAIYSYYFHRLLQRAADITILYNNATQEGQTGEMSRFMLQLMVESPHTFTYNTLQASQNFVPFRPQRIEKSQQIIDILLQRFQLEGNEDKRYPLLTPTAINRYMRCQLQFYYYYVCGLKELDDIEDDSIDNRIFGNIFHEAARIIYTRLLSQSQQIQRRAIDELLKQKADIERAVDAAFQKELFKLPAHVHNAKLTDMMNGLQIINREVIIHYLRQLLTVDRELAPFTIMGLECDVTAKLQTPHLTTTIGGRIDRLDQIMKPGQSAPQIRVIDYKTGGSQPPVLKSVEDIFNEANLSKHSDYYLQTLLYACIVRTSAQLNASQLPVSPALLFIQHAAANDYDPVLKFGDDPISDVETDRLRFGELLTDTVDQMFNPEIAFSPTSDLQRCQSCPYRLLCGSMRK